MLGAIIKSSTMIELKISFVLCPYNTVGGAHLSGCSLAEGQYVLLMELDKNKIRFPLISPFMGQIKSLLFLLFWSKAKTC